MSCTKTVERIDLPFGLWTRVGRRKHKLYRIRQMTPVCPGGFHVGTLSSPGKYDSTCASFGPPESTTQMANRSVQQFLHSSWQGVVGHAHCPGMFFPTVIAPLCGGSGPHWRHLANASEPFVCGGDAALCQLLQDHLLVHGQVTIIFVVSVCLSVCLFVVQSFSQPSLIRFRSN